MRDEAIALVVALKGHTLPKDAENALNRLCNALSQQKHDVVPCPYCKNSATLGAVFYDQTCHGCVKRMTNAPKHDWLDGVIDVKPIGYHSLQLVFRSQTDIENFKNAYKIKDES
jgi:hypothetical protein